MSLIKLDTTNPLINPELTYVVWQPFENPVTQNGWITVAQSSEHHLVALKN